MTIDQRLEFLVQSTESLHSTVQQQSAQIAELRVDMGGLTREVRRFAREVRAFRSIAQAMLMDHESRLRALEGDESEDDDLGDENGEAERS